VIYDCFIFCNELEILEIRFQELFDIVDRFVLVEAPVTLSGRPKPLYFAQNKERFASYLDKVIHLVIPRERLLNCGNAWAREHLSRRWIRNGLCDILDSDLVLISDVDEIPSAQGLKRYTPKDGVTAFEQQFSYYYLNLTCGSWNGTKALSGAEWKRLGADAQMVRHVLPCEVIPEGGWHFSFYGGDANVKGKLLSYSHQELLGYGDPAWIRVALSTGCDIFQRGIEWRFSSQSCLPECVEKNPARYARGHPDVEFNEIWYSAESLRWLFETYQMLGPGVEGIILDIGPWEGRTTLALGAASFPEGVMAVDTWRGNEQEGDTNITVVAAKLRDIKANFARNITALGRGNICHHHGDSNEFLRELTESIKFVHLDADNSYRYVRDTILLLIPKMAQGGVICGNNIISNSESRSDLESGVEKAVRELLPGHVRKGNHYSWIKRN
jgi:beta-1,4-mannosyl-glycoprotein beta-1,4-N-acetylglucosaminyltransferase